MPTVGLGAPRTQADACRAQLGPSLLLWVFNFGLACAIEFIAASMGRPTSCVWGVIPAPGPRQADLMVVSGTVTDKMAPAIRRL